MRLGPPLYLRRVWLQALISWILIRAALPVLSVLARWPHPLSVRPGTAALLVGLVVAVTWIDLRRKNLTTLLPALGIPVGGVIAWVAGVAVVGEIVLALVQR